MTASPQLPRSPLVELRIIRDALEDKKGGDIRILDLSGVSSTLDYFVICSAASQPQLQALERSVLEKLREYGVRPLAVEGPSSRWVLINLGAIVVHLMSPEAREFYDLEGLWADASPIELPESVV